MKKAAVSMIALIRCSSLHRRRSRKRTAGSGEAADQTDHAVIAVGFGIAVAAFGGGLGQGRIAAAACEGIARNPGAAGGVRAAMILGLVFVETLALFTFAMILALLEVVIE